MHTLFNAYKGNWLAISFVGVCYVLCGAVSLHQFKWALSGSQGCK